MAHFAEVIDNVVTRVVVINNAVMLDEFGKEHEALGMRFCADTFGGTNWFQTSYNGNYRKNFAGIGYTFDPIRQAFIPPQPFPSWILNDETCRWDPPSPYPTDDKNYEWDEDTLSWVER